MADFDAQIREDRAIEEDTPQFHAQHKVIVYDPRAWSNELLQPVYGKTAICGICQGRGHQELKRLPCKHCIHEGACLRGWLNSNTLANLEYPNCRARINVRQVPPTPLTDAFLYKTSARPDYGDLPDYDETESPEPDQPDDVSVRTRTASWISRQPRPHSGEIGGPGWL